MRSEGDIAAEADLKQAKAFAAQFRADCEHLENRLWMQTQRLTAAMLAESNGEAATARRAIRQTEDDIRGVKRMLEKLERRFPTAFTD